MGRPAVGSCARPRYCTMLGWRISLRKRHSCSNSSRFLGLLGSTRIGWRSLAAHGSSPSIALHTWPYRGARLVANERSRNGRRLELAVPYRNRSSCTVYTYKYAEEYNQKAYRGMRMRKIISAHARSARNLKLVYMRLTVFPFGLSLL